MTCHEEKSVKTMFARVMGVGTLEELTAAGYSPWENMRGVVGSINSPHKNPTKHHTNTSILIEPQ